MNYTENYQLPQWEEADRLLRTDFNDAMTKVDTGLSVLETETTTLMDRAGAHLLKTLEVSDSTDEYPISLTEIQWDQWKAVHISVDPVTTTDTTPIKFLTDSWDDLGNGRGNGNVPGRQHIEFHHLIFYPLFDKRRPVCAIYFTAINSGIYHTDSSFESFKTLYMCSDNNQYILPGTTVQIWGEK